MKLLCLPAFAFLCFLHGIVVDGQRHLKGSKPKDLPDDVTTTIHWPNYCRCFYLATKASTDAVKQQAKQCFRDFFQSEEQRRILRLHRGRREECLTPANDGDSECKVVRAHYLGLKFRRDINKLHQRFPPEKAKVYVVTLYPFWKNHPDIQNVCPPNATYQGLAIAIMIRGFSRMNSQQLSQGNDTVNRYAELIEGGPLGRNLIEEVDRICYRYHGVASTGSDSYQVHKKNFCDLDFAQRIIRKMKNFHTEANKPDGWGNQELTNIYNALRLNFVALSEYSDRYIGALALQLTDTEKVEGYKNMINLIIKLIHTRNMAQLRTITWFLPNDILTCSGTQTSEACHFKKILDQLVTHFRASGATINGKKRKLLDTERNYNTFLRTSLTSRILTVVQRNQFLTIDLAEEITDRNDQRFTELRNYFVELQSFNDHKANADIGFIDGWITKYKSSIEDLSQQNGDLLSILIKSLVSGLNAQIAEKIAATALAILEACNPLKKIFGGSTLGDIMAATAAFTETFTNRLFAQDLKVSVEAVIEKTEKIAAKLDGNDVFIANVLELVKSSETSNSVDFETQKRKFLDKYNNYSPAVQKTELTEVQGLWENMITAACNEIDKIDTTAGNIAVTEIKASGTCWRLPVGVNKMMETYLEIYDFQFDLMEALASAMRAKVGKREAQNIASGYVSFPERETNNARKYRSIYTLSFLTHHIQTWNLIEMYCDKLEYKEGGLRPRECQGEATDINLLLSRNGRHCSGNHRDTVRIPITPATPGDEGFLNLTNLYKTEDVSFRIASRQWLVNNGWLNEAQAANSAMYVKEFDIFLPTVTGDSVRYTTTSTISGECVLSDCPECTQYILRDDPQSTTYKEGYDASCDESQKIGNPYTICPSNPLPKVCRISESQSQPQDKLYPSIYCRRSFRINGYESTPIPDPGNTDMYIKAKITYCLLGRTGGSSVGYKRSSARTSRKCCQGNNYFSEDADSCSPCPSGSPNLHAYYCEQNANAMMS
ncbi:uncharacterized protein [Montipora foliosa]|uniref:uncharacterized protein n=1 Tax=Montipora foliosa TaxID=591990 RepID=UPI0035F20A33